MVSGIYRLFISDLHHRRKGRRVEAALLGAVVNKPLGNRRRIYDMLHIERSTKLARVIALAADDILPFTKRWLTGAGVEIVHYFKRVIAVLNQ